MKKTIFTIAILFSIFSVALTSCKKDDDTENTDPAVLTGNYEVFIDGSELKKEVDVAVGLIKDNDGNYVNNVSMGVLLISGFPRTVGADVTMETNSDPGVIITSGVDSYYSNFGTLTRTSASKISFNGICTRLGEIQEYTITGFVESEALEDIN